MSIKEVDKYKNNCVASTKKHVFSRLLDYFSYFVGGYLLFTLVFAIGVNFPGYQAANNRLSEATNNALTFVDSTHLQRKEAEGTSLISIETDALAYVNVITKTGAYVNNLKYPVKQEDGTWLDTDIQKSETFIQDLSTYEKDNLSYYYKIFKKAGHTGLESYMYDNVDYSSDIDTFLYKKIMALDDSSWIETSDPNYARAEGASRYVVLNAEMAQKMINKVAKGEDIDPVATSLYNEIYNKYVVAVEYGIDEVETKSEEYKALDVAFQKAYQEVATHYAWMYVVAFLFAFVIINLVVSLIAKEPTTLGQKVMNIAMGNKTDFSLPVWKYILYFTLNCFLDLSSMAIALYFIGALGVTSVYITPHITLLAVLIALFTLNIISLFMPFFNKKKHDLTSLICGILIKDKNEFEGSPAVIEASSEKDGSGKSTN